MIQIIATKPRIKLWTRYLNGYHISNRYILLLGFAGVPKNIINQSRNKYNKNYICQHSGLNRLVARLMFGSFNPKYEYFLEPCSISRVIYICKSAKIPLSKTYQINKTGKIIFCLNNSINGCWFPKLFNLNVLDQIKQYVRKIRQYSNLEIEIRLHPKDRTKEKIDLLKRNNLTYNNDDHQVLFKNAYCLVVDHTTMVYESIVRGIPVFYLGQNREECLGNDIYLIPII